MGRRDEDDRPPVELWGAPEPPPETTRVEVAPDRRRWRTLGLLAVVAVVLGGLLTLDGSGDGPDDEAAESKDEADGGEDGASDRTTTTRRTGTTTTSSTTTSTLPPGPVLGRPLGATLVFVGAGPRQAWTYLNLDTGAMGELDVRSSDAYDAIAVRGGVVARSSGGLRFVPADGGPSTDLGVGSGYLLPTTTIDAVWVAEETSYGLGPLRLVDLRGRVLMGPLEVPGGWASYGTSEGVVHQNGGRIFLSDGERSRSVGVGSVLGVEGRWLLVHVCGEDARCHLVRLDPLSGEQVTIAPWQGADMTWALLAPGGELVALSTFRPPDEAGGGGVQRVEVLGPEPGWEWALEDRDVDELGGWLPDASGLVVINRGRTTARVIRVEPGLDPWIEELPTGAVRSFERVLVVPH